MMNCGTTMYKDIYTQHAKKDAKVARRNGFKDKVDDMIKVVRRDPYEDTPSHFYEELKGNLKGVHTRRLDYSNRFAYQVLPNVDKETHPKTGEVYEGIVKVINIWGHYPPK